MPSLADKVMKNNILILAMALVFGLSATVFAQNKFVQNPQTTSLQTLGGASVNLADSKGKVVVLAIGASWLPLSKQQIITTNKLVKKYAGKDVVIYWITTESSNAKSKNYATDETIKAFATKNNLSATVLRDSDGAVTLKKYAVDQLPSFVILDKTGKQFGTPFGGLDPDNEPEIFNQVSGAIDKLF